MEIPSRLRKYQIRIITEAVHDTVIEDGYIEDAINKARTEALDLYKGRVKYIEVEEVD